MSGLKAGLPFEQLSEFIERAMNMPEPEWVIPGMVPGTGGLLIVADPNVGKTWLALIIAKVSEDRPVFLVEEEHTARSVAERLTGMAIPFGKRVNVLHRFGVLLEDESTFQALLATVAEASRPILILDPLAAIMAGNENDTKEAGVFVQRLRALQRASPELLLVILHHTSKAGSRGDASSSYAARGSSQFSAWADTQLNLKGQQGPHEPGQIAFTVEVVKMRDAERGDPKTVALRLGTGEVAFGEDGQAKLRILEALSAAAKPLMSVNALNGAAGGNRSANLKAIAALQRSGLIRNDPNRGFELVPAVPLVLSGSGTTGSRFPPLRGEPPERNRGGTDA
jgi:hypothetical protein